MDFFDYIINRNAAQKENPGKLSSYREAAELICSVWSIGIAVPAIHQDCTRQNYVECGRCNRCHRPNSTFCGKD